jgi:hypothetical protein
VLRFHDRCSLAAPKRDPELISTYPILNLSGAHHAYTQLAGNRHIRIPGRKVTELGLTMQQVMGLNVTSRGSWDKTSKVITEILT